MSRSWIAAAVTSALAIIAWITLGLSRAGAAKVVAVKAPSGLLGTIVVLDAGVKFIVPPAFTYVVDDNALRVGDSRGIEIEVAVATGARLAELPGPMQAARAYASQRGLSITTIVTPTDDRLIVHAETTASGTRVRHSLYMFVREAYRVTVRFVVTERQLETPGIAKLADELVGRVMLP